MCIVLINMHITTMCQHLKFMLLRITYSNQHKRKKRGIVLTFFAAALKASLCGISGFAALIRWISSLQMISGTQS